jgi:hypothetical protein
MRQIRVIVALLAALVVSAVMVASASALPELTKPGTTSELTSKATTGESEGTTTLESAEGTKVTCEKAKSTGQVKGKTEFNETVVKFTGCKESLFNGACQNTSTSGEIKTNVMSGRIAYINKATPEVGLRLAPTTGTSFVTFECLGGFLKDEVRGSVIGVFGKGEQNKSVTTLKLVYEKGETAGSQKVTKFEGESTESFLESKLNSGEFKRSNQQGKGTTKFAESAELKA